jgi:hypothetical protein
LSGIFESDSSELRVIVVLIGDLIEENNMIVTSSDNAIVINIAIAAALEAGIFPC